MRTMLRFAAVAGMLAVAACSVNTAPPAPVVMQQPAVTTVPGGSTVVVHP